MEKRNIGKSGLSAPFLGLGTWAIGGGSWWGDNDDALSVKAIETAVEQGITWIDTAPIYGLYHSEEVVGEALRHIDRDKVILSTKCGLEWRHESPVLHKVVDGVQTYRDLSAKSIIEDVEDSLRRPIYVPESMDIMKVVQTFREHGVHEAAVLDEYGSLSGIVTLHDILEELLGIMPAGEEEKQEEANRIIRRSPNEWLMEGLLTIEEFKDFFDLDEDLPGEEDDLYKTLAGFVTYKIGRIPAETDTCSWKNFTFEVMDMDNLRVDKILVTKKGL